MKLVALLVFVCVSGGSPASLGQDAGEWSARLEQGDRLLAEGKYAEAEGHFLEAVKLAERLAVHDGRLAVALRGLGAACFSQERWESAERLYRAALEARPAPPEALATLRALAELFQAQRKLPQAAEIYQRALTAAESLHGVGHPEVAMALDDLAEIYRAQAMHEAAEQFFRRALAIKRSALPRDHPGLAESLLKISAAVRNYHGPEHPYLAAVLTELGDYMLALGQLGEAGAALGEALQIREKALGPEHPEIAASLRRVAAYRAAQSRFGEAERLLRRAVAMAERTLGIEHPDTGGLWSDLGAVYQAQGKYDAAEGAYETSLEITRRALGDSHAAVASVLMSQGGLRVAQRRDAEAEAPLRRALNIREGWFAGDAPEMVAALSALASVYSRLGKFEEAQGMYRRAIEGMERNRAAFARMLGIVAGEYERLLQSKDRKEWPTK